MNDERINLVVRFLEQAFDGGKTCGAFSDQHSEYWSPMFYHELAPSLLRQLDSLAKHDEGKVK